MRSLHSCNSLSFFFFFLCLSVLYNFRNFLNYLVQNYILPKLIWAFFTGYGSRATTDECPEAIFIMCVQSITGVMIQCFMAGIVFAKLSRPKNRSQTLMFSRYACICLRDGKLCFMFRVGDMRKSHIIGANISAQVIRRKTTAEGEVRKLFCPTL